MTARRTFGTLLDDPDALFMTMNDTIFGIAATRLLIDSGAAERLAQGPADADTLAQACGLPAGALRRALDYLLAHEVIGQQVDGRYCATPRTLRIGDVAGFVANAQLTMQLSSQLLEGLRQRRTPFEVQFGERVFEHFAHDPQMASAFGSFMGFMTRRVTRFLFAHHRFHPFGTVADIGGSMGDLLLAVLAEYPGARGILFDLPATVELARARLAGSPQEERMELVDGSFFERVPVADLYLMKQILHDWSDEECRAILGTVRRAIPAHGRLVVIDHILSDRPAPDEAQGTDLAMLLWDTGHERRLREFEALFAASGFVIDRVTRNPHGHSAIEVVPA